MCITPTRLPTGQEVACRKCWQCVENRITDWVGRCIAESQTAVAAHSVTLTYGGGDHLAAAVLTYSDVQKYIKALRVPRKVKGADVAYPVRYFAVGEYGSAKGRAHWHCMLFWQENVPPHDLRLNFQEEHWPHGFSYWDECDGPSIRYVCKYIQKDSEAGRQSHLSMSKKPPLGAPFFIRRAHQFVRQGVSPQDAFYSFPRFERKHRRYMLAGASLDLFLQAFIDEWCRVHPGRWWPHSELLNDYCDRQAASHLDPEWAPTRRKPGAPRPFLPAPAGSGPVQFSEPHNAYFVEHQAGRLWWSFDLDGERSWENEIRVELGNPRVLRAAWGYRAATGRSSAR